MKSETVEKRESVILGEDSEFFAARSAASCSGKANMARNEGRERYERLDESGLEMARKDDR